MICVQIIEYWGTNATDRFHASTKLSDISSNMAFSLLYWWHVISSHATLFGTEHVLKISFSSAPYVLAELSFPPKHVLLRVPESHSDMNFWCLNFSVWCFSDFVTVPCKQRWCGWAGILTAFPHCHLLPQGSASLLCFTLLVKVEVCLCPTMKLDEDALRALQRAAAGWIGKLSASIPAKRMLSSGIWRGHSWQPAY